MEKFQIDVNSEIPLVHQVTRILRAKIVKNELQIGETLPSVRELGSQLEINFNTVAKAFRILEKEGLLEIRHGLGVRVRDHKINSEFQRPEASMSDDLQNVICQLSLEGKSREQVVDFFAEALGQHYSEVEN